MGYNARNDEIRDNVTRMRQEWEAQRGALAIVRRFNATLSAKGYAWFWPKIAAALTSKHHWLVINCDSCGTVVDLDLRVKPRDPEASIRVALRDVQCPPAMDTADHASSRWLGIRRFEIEPLTHLLLTDDDLANLRFESLDAMFRCRGEKHRKHK
jgi:hypothetical protein